MIEKHCLPASKKYRSGLPEIILLLFVEKKDAFGQAGVIGSRIHLDKGLSQLQNDGAGF